MKRNTKIEQKQLNLMSNFGFSNQLGSVHTKRTMMFSELETLLYYVDIAEASHAEYIDAIVIENCLGKRSVATRKYTANYLTNLYMLDFSYTLYRCLHYLWFKDEPSRPLLALLCAFARDGLLRDSANYILKLQTNSRISKVELEELIDSMHPGRFGQNMLQSLVRNLLSTWTQSGHLLGRSKKTRKTPEVGGGAVTYALLLGYLSGIRGRLLFDSEYIKLLDVSLGRSIELAEEASRKGWLIFKRVDDVMEVLFPKLLSKQELEMIYEQS